MRDLKSELADVAKHNMVVLQNMPQHHELVKANKVLLLVVCSLMSCYFFIRLFNFARQCNVGKL